jgi:hypothetical protein
MESWYKKTLPEPGVYEYLINLENIWKVINPAGDWVPYRLTCHQIDWHCNDVAVLGVNAKDRIVVKSRNTSFTTSAVISNLMDVPNCPNEIFPIVRLNMRRAEDLIAECKEMIKNMTPLLINGKLYPFNPADVDMDKVGSIRFPNGAEFRAMPANAASAETIRGMRKSGSAGIIDECNFMRDYRKIYIASRDSSRGSMLGKKRFQLNIGTTRKGRMTNFNLWFEGILKTGVDNILVFYWPVFNPDEVDLSKDLREQNLKPIVWWHDINDLENKRKEDLTTFKEEYMCEIVDSDESLYPYELIEAAINNELDCLDNPIEGEVYTMGVDPAATSDFFSISIFEINTRVQRFLYYKRKVDLGVMEKFCENLILKWKPVKCRIDANGLGMQLSQTLKNKFGGIIEALRGVVKVKAPGKITGDIPLKEYLHTNMLKLFNYKDVSIFPDDTQIKHYLMWRRDYTCPNDSELGHGDTTISNGLALLPIKWRHIKEGKVGVVREKEVKEDINILPEQEDIEW